jgi:hypothetical protein
MADWVVYDTGAAAATLPPPLAAAYAAWLTAEVRAQRLGLIVSGVVADFRKAVAADADPVGGENAASVPVSCLRQVSAVVWYTLALEMGEDATGYRAAWLDSEIYLRRLYQDLEAGGTASGATGTPLYSPGSTGGASSGGRSGNLVYVSGYDPAAGINSAPPAVESSMA